MVEVTMCRKKNEKQGFKEGEPCKNKIATNWNNEEKLKKLFVEII